MGEIHGTARRANAIAVIAVVVAILTFAISAFGSYGHNDTELKQRLSVVETKQTEGERRLERMELTLDRIWERISR